ncbi:hypothetical protein ACHAXS_001072 [Conticribra weissflogii]
MNVINGTCGLPMIDFIETYGHVVQWTTVCMRLILENLLGHKNPNKLMSLLPSFVLLLKKMRMSIWRYLLVSSKVV